jgi:hypothetical protein
MNETVRGACPDEGSTENEATGAPALAIVYNNPQEIRVSINLYMADIRSPSEIVV